MVIWQQHWNNSNTSCGWAHLVVLLIRLHTLEAGNTQEMAKKSLTIVASTGWVKSPIFSWKILENSHLMVCACSEYIITIRNLFWTILNDVTLFPLSLHPARQRSFAFFLSSQSLKCLEFRWNSFNERKSRRKKNIKWFPACPNYFDRCCRLQQHLSKCIKWNNGNDLVRTHTASKHNKICMQQTNN